MRFRLKITVCMIWLLSLSFGIGGSLMLSSSFKSALEQERNAAESSYDFLIKTVQLVNTISSLPNRSDIADVIEQLNDAGMIGFSSVCLFTGDGIIYRSGSLETDELYGGSGISIEALGDGKLYYKLSGVVNTESGPMYLTALWDISSAYEMRHEQYKTYMIVFGATIAVGAVLSYIMSRLLTKPLDRLTNATKKLASGELSYRCGMSSGDELGQLSRDFDAMASKLEDSMEQMHDTVRRQEEFMGSFAHELKTPMTSIIGYADLLRGQSLNAEERLDAANYIFCEGRRLESLSLKLLDIMVLKNTELDLKSTSPAELIESVVQYLRPSYEKRGIAISCSCGSGQCLLEPDLVKSLIVNLMDNAYKALDNGGKIDISSKMLADGCSITVKDNGPGIPPEAMAHLTEAFYRADKSRSRAQGGAGLGLSLCNEIAGLHKGSISFESSAGKGTGVTVELHGGAV